MTCPTSKIPIINYLVNHAFLPPQLPQGDDYQMEQEFHLCEKVNESVNAYRKHLLENEQSQWSHVSKMLKKLCVSQERSQLSKDTIESSIMEMRPGHILAFYIRAQNASVIIRKFDKETVFESFEVSAPDHIVMQTKGKIICSYPGPAIAIPNDVVDDNVFCSELSSFLSQMSVDVLDSTATTTKARSTVVEERDIPSPRYITELLTGILRGIGRVTEVTRIEKRIADDVLLKDAELPWRRSPIWLVIRVAMQTSLYDKVDGHHEYKKFLIFFLTRILRLAIDKGISSELIFCMRAKISRRVFKLGSGVTDFLLKDVRDAEEAAGTILRERWSSVQKDQEKSPAWAPQDLNILGDTNLSLHNSNIYLSRIMQDVSSPNTHQLFRPNHPPRLKDFHDFHSLTEQRLSKAFGTECGLALMDFEYLVQNHLDTWVQHNLHDSSGCVVIATCITQYSDAALKLYDGNPENLSLMLLTLFTLWMAVDQMAVAQYPMLKEYSPEVSETLLERLLLRKAESFGRLTCIQRHLRRRQSEAIPEKSIFTDKLDGGSFAVRYFQTSEKHRSLKLRIEADASSERQEKLAELASANSTHTRLTIKSRDLSHDIWINYRGYEQHSWGCEKCRLSKEADNMVIAVHEWPLSSDPLIAEATVFELDCPISFGAWRSATYELLHDICTTVDTPPANPPIQLTTYSAVHKYSDSNRIHRITLASTTTSFLQSHYRTTSIPSQEASVCVNNGLNLRLFDSLGSHWAANPFTACSTVPHCTLRLPRPSPYSFLQYAVEETSHTSNHILARQSDCPKELSLHEYLAFACLRSGGRLQWLNIVREIAVGSLSFRKEEVHTLIVQAAWQAGHLNSCWEREWHLDLESATFGLALLQELEQFMSSIEANWLESASMRTVTALVSRLLVSAESQEVVQGAYSIMRQARKVTCGWMHQLSQKLQDSKGECEAQYFQRKLCEIAITCRGTFDVDLHHLEELLKAEGNVTVLLECAITVHSNTPPTANVPHDLRRLLDRDIRLSHSLSPILLEKIREKRASLDRAIAAIWIAYRSGSVWEPLSTQNGRWLVTSTASEAACESQQVQFNILEGQLLIDGMPLGRLPQNITKHALYVRVFGQQVLDVIPADMAGMDFATRGHISNFQVLFALREDGDLVIRTRRDIEILQLVPHNKLSGDLPELLVNGFTHWIDLSNGCIELRSLETLWQTCAKNWKLYFSTGGQSKMHNGSNALVDIRSSTFRMVSSQLKPLEYAEYLNVTYCSEGRRLTVTLPRFRLSFFLNETDYLECQNFPGMIVDVQSTGTMFGLANQLVLQSIHSVGEEMFRSRRVLIPYGAVHFEIFGNHTTIWIDTRSKQTVKYQEYIVDSRLGRLVGNASLLSRLYKVYLHAISSHCLADPLTGRTGTEEALHDLCSARCRSFQRLSNEEIDVLHRIKSLTPTRRFYPDHKEIMQTVEWSNLPSLAQHHMYYAAVTTITQYAERLRVFQWQSQLNTQAPSPKSIFLSERASYRTSAILQRGIGCQLASKDVDVIWRPEITEGAQKEAGVFDISAAVYSWSSQLPTTRQLYRTFKQWGRISSDNDGLSLSYSREWQNLDMSDSWITLYNMCRRGRRSKHQFRMIFSLSVMAYNSTTEHSLILTLLASATNSSFRNLDPPSWESYDLTKGEEPQRASLCETVRSFTVSYESSSEAQLSARPGENEASLKSRRYASFEANINRKTEEMVDSFIQQWPSACPRVPSGTHTHYFRVSELMVSIQASFLVWYQNKDLREFAEQVQSILDKNWESPHTTPTSYPLEYPIALPQPIRPTNWPVELDQLLGRDAPTMPPSPSLLQVSRSTGLRSLLAEFQQDKSILNQLYGNDLESSRKDLDKKFISLYPNYNPYPMEEFVKHRNHCSKHVEDCFTIIQHSLSPLTPAEVIIAAADLWPRITTVSLLGKLAFGSSSALAPQWRRVLVSFAEAILWLQRSQRLLSLALDGNSEEIFKELSNLGPELADNLRYLDWLLIQVDGDFLLRPIQALVAQEMISPISGQNTVLQLNMGEGKSSVIVPLVAAALSNGHLLTRVVVLKSLSSQMFQLLVERLSNLAGRQIFYMPFSRAITPDRHGVLVIQSLYEECMAVGGILVIQPEHILSFKLMGIDRLLSSSLIERAEHKAVSKALIENQKWLEMRSRDILDESDEILHVRYQLIYTVGQQQPLEDHPDRWTTIQQVFSLVRKHAPSIQREYPTGLEVHNNANGRFPLVRIIEREAGDTLISSIANDVLNGAISNFSLSRSPRLVQQAALRMIISDHIAEDEALAIKSYCGANTAWKSLLLLRGLFHHGILKFALKEKRWRVNYGLDLSRSLLAVPYRAKDVPAVRAEFGHPDIAISLTCLSYYYGGLTEDQLDVCFDLLFKLDNPNIEYEKWVHNHGEVPKSLCQLSGINTSDPEQKKKRLCLFQNNHAVIDFFLAQSVFPKEAKEFPQKLSTSGWDIAEVQNHVKTGFSGTNDNRYLLPISITQRDAPQLRGTNAQVLSYLLQPENQHYFCIGNENGETSAAAYLDCIRVVGEEQKDNIRVLLDIGAQMLELRNNELAEYWLDRTPDAPAVVFFNDDDELVVRTRDGTTETLVTSSYSHQLNDCLVYLDDAHTRGTDLKLPRGTRAAVTLGPKVTKDRLVQGCMRMRKLGHGQSLVFLAPIEVDRLIRKAAGKANREVLGVLDILRWAMLVTCTEIEHFVPQWAQQGKDYESRKLAWHDLCAANELADETTAIEKVRTSWLQPEARTLQDMYGIPLGAGNGPGRSNTALDIPQIRERCELLGVTSFYDTRMGEEQEREVSHEIEKERQIQRPPQAKAATHRVHVDIKAFISRGVVQPGSSQFVQAFSSLATLPDAPLNPRVWSSNLLATRDFATTVEKPDTSTGDYLRPITWILSSTALESSKSILVLISPYEANALLPDIRISKYVHLHQYSPKVTQAMRSFDDLKFHCVPSLPTPWTSCPPTLLTTQLNLFAGQLYIPDSETYQLLCEFLGVCTGDWGGQADDEAPQYDGFVLPGNRHGKMRDLCHFAESPLPFLKEVVGLRRKGMSYLKTHIGQILHGRLLTEEDFY